MRFLFSHYHQGTRKGLGSLIIGAKAKSYHNSRVVLLDSAQAVGAFLIAFHSHSAKRRSSK